LAEETVGTAEPADVAGTTEAVGDS
jgi:hypothetical protein